MHADSTRPTPEPRSPFALSSVRRRDFLKMTAGAALAGMLPGGLRGAVAGAPSGFAGARGNAMPGRIFIYRDTAMNGHGTISMSQVEAAVHQGVRLLTAKPTVAGAFESLLPGVTATSRVAIKVNCINSSTPTRWEVARGVVSGLAAMLGGSYDVSRVTIYDNQSLSASGYVASNFTFNGHTAVLSSSNNPSSYAVVPGHYLSQYLIDANYIINLPVLKSHYDANNQITAAMKNHYGSCNPSSLCGETENMLWISSDGYIRNRTSLIITDAIRATYNGGPGDPPQSWLLFPEHTPNTLFFTTDPVTNEYWARDMINRERNLHGWGPKPCPWIETAGDSPFELGICDPGQMQAFQLEPSDVAEPASLTVGATLDPNVPNPFSDSTVLRFRLPRSAAATVTVVDASGRLVRRLGHHDLSAGAHELTWDGRDGAGRSLPSGIYFAHLESGGVRQSRRITLAR